MRSTIRAASFAVVAAAAVALSVAGISAAEEAVRQQTQAAAGDGADGAVAEGVSEDGADKLVSRLKALRPNIPIERVSPSPLPGIYALEVAGGTTFYGTADGRYLFAGDLYELGADDLVNLAEEGRAERRRELLADVPRSEMVVFSPRGPTKAAINVFTDVDCGYCQKLHQEVPALNRMGVEVRYLAYPRAGIGSESYDKIVSAWCAEDPNTAITRLKALQPIPEAHCENPVARQYELGQEMGVTGTPAIILEDGKLLPGYMPADKLAEAVGI